MKSYISKQIITHEMTNNAYKHLHHAEIIKLFEKARTEFFESLGFTLESFEKQGLLFVVAKISVEYKREVQEGEVQVTCSHFSIIGKNMEFTQELYNHREKLAVVAKVTLAVLSRQVGRSILVPGEVKAAIEGFFAQ